MRKPTVKDDDAQSKHCQKADKKSAPDLPDWPHRGCSYPGHLVARYAALRSSVELHRPRTFGLARFFGFAGEPMRGWIETIVQLLSVGVGAAGIFLIGLLAENVLGRQLLKGLEWLLMQIPFIRGIYSATRQFLETFSGDSTKAFRKVVLFEYPRKGLWTMGLLTGDAKGEVAERIPEKMVSVFVPTTPNPTSGWLIFVPVESVQELDMDVDDAFKMIISGGVLTPGIEPAESSQSTDEV